MSFNLKNGKYKESGRTSWYLNNELHREDGPAIEWDSGRKAWHLNGQRHRQDGPAIEDTFGTKEWFLHGQRHREDGPAVEHEHILGLKEWWINGVEFSEEQFMRWLDKKNLNEKLHATLPPKQKTRRGKI